MRNVLPLMAVLLLVGCGSEVDPAGSDIRGKVRIDGSSTVYPISEAVAEEFNKLEPGVRVTVGVSGTGGGFKKFIAGEIDINAASREIRPAEIKAAAEAGVTYIEVPVAYDGLSVIVNLDNDWVDYLTVDELQQIWKPGSRVENWSDVRPGWPDEAIRLYGPGTDSGTFDYFTSVINGQEQASRADFMASEDDNVLVHGIAGDRYSLGYFGFAYYVENTDKLRIVPVDSGTGPVAPTLENINTGRYAPLSRPVYLYVNPASLEDEAFARFLDFYIRQAGELVEEVGYVSLPDAAYEAALARIALRETGTSYGEAASVTRLTGQ